jgi:hypothetical protein
MNRMSESIDERRRAMVAGVNRADTPEKLKEAWVDAVTSAYDLLTLLHDGKDAGLDEVQAVLDKLKLFLPAARPADV